jgi:hypothetical protein
VERPVINHLLIFEGEPSMADYFEIIGNDGNNHAIRNNHDVRTVKVVYPGTTTNAVITNTRKAKAGATSADVYTYTADVPDPNVTGGFAARKGDVWRKVYELAGVALTGWTAEIHLGIKQGITITPVTVTPPPSTGLPATLYIATKADGSDRVEYRKA